jgi:hypothetical protein
MMNVTDTDRDSQSLPKVTATVAKLYRQAADELQNGQTEAAEASLGQAGALVQEFRAETEDSEPVELDEDTAASLATELQEAQLLLQEAIGTKLEKLADERKELDRGFIQLGRLRRLLASDEPKQVDIRR